MINANFAVEGGENYHSRMDHVSRQSFNLSFQSSCTITATASAITANLPNQDVVHLYPPPGMSNKLLTLSGPHSPLEAQLTGLLNLDNCKICLDTHSVNCVILNGDINEAHSRFYVASNVTKNRTNGITLREITMMPNIAGLAEILALVFCPKMVIRRSDDNTRYVSMLTGLGDYPETKRSIFPLHEATFPINVELTDEDFSDINQLRFNMSQLLATPATDPIPALTDGQKYKLHKKIASLISKYDEIWNVECELDKLD
jgi:ATP-dependent RNA helicase TDRD9